MSLILYYVDRSDFCINNGLSENNNCFMSRELLSKIRKRGTTLYNQGKVNKMRFKTKIKENENLYRIIVLSEGYDNLKKPHEYREYLDMYDAEYVNISKIVV